MLPPLQPGGQGTGAHPLSVTFKGDFAMQHSSSTKGQNISSHWAAKDPTLPPPGPSGHSLWVQLVQGAVYTHGDPQVFQPLVFPPFLHDSSHASTTELGCTTGHNSTHLLDYDAVLTCAVQAQLLQDPPHLKEGQAVTAGKHSGVSEPASWALRTAQYNPRLPQP